MFGCFVRCLICGFWIDRKNIQITPQGAGSSADDFCVCKTCYAKHFQQPASQPSNRRDAQLYFWGLTRWRYKWATDPVYSEKLIKLYADLKANGIAERIRT